MYNNVEVQQENRRPLCRWFEPEAWLPRLSGRHEGQLRARFCPRPCPRPRPRPRYQGRPLLAHPRGLPARFRGLRPVLLRVGQRPVPGSDRVQEEGQEEAQEGWRPSVEGVTKTPQLS